jgi:hypothetical protein
MGEGNMEENKGEKNPMGEAWDEVGKAVNEATEIYVKELGTYLDWVQNVRKEFFEQAVSTAQELSRIGENQWAFWNRMQKSLSVYGGIPTWADVPSKIMGAGAKRSTRST